MIKRRNDPATTEHGLQLASPDDGCCPRASNAACLYRFQWATLPTSFGNVIVTIDGANVTKDLALTYTNTQSLYEALRDMFSKSSNENGLASVVEPGDIKVYMDKYVGIAGNTDLTVEIISTYPIVSIATNQGTLASATPQCDVINMCEYRTTFELTDNFKLVIGDTLVTNTTYATGALLRTGVNTALGTANLNEEVKFLVHIPAAGTTMYLKIFVKEGLPIYVDDVLLSRRDCGIIYLNQ